MQPINLKGETYLLKGNINVDFKKNLPDDIPVNIFDDQETLVGSTTARLVSSEGDATGASIYEYSVWAKFGEKLNFVPQDSRYDYFVNDGLIILLMMLIVHLHSVYLKRFSIWKSMPCFLLLYYSICLL